MTCWFVRDGQQLELELRAMGMARAARRGGRSVERGRAARGAAWRASGSGRRVSRHSRPYRASRPRRGAVYS